MLLEHLGQYDEFVVNRLSHLVLFHTVRGEIKKVLTLNLLNMGVRTKGFEGIENGAVGAERSQGPMTAHVVQMAVET